MKFPIRRFLTVLFLLAGLGQSLTGAESRERSASSAAAAKAAKVELNTASLSELEALPGVGPQTAKAIVAARPFKTVAELERVEGIGPAKMAELRSRVTVARGAVAATAPKATRQEAERGAKAPGGDEGPRASGGRVDVNTAELAALERLPGVGPATARAIVAARPFESVEDLERVPGIGPAKLETLRAHVTVRARRSAAMETKRGGSVEVPTSTPSRRAVKAPAEARTPPLAGPATRPAESPRNDEELEPTGRPSAGRAGVGASEAKVNLNTASRAELEALPEIGPVKAQAIIEARPFRSIEDVMRVSGIKEATFEAIRDRITVR